MEWFLDVSTIYHVSRACIVVLQLNQQCKGTFLKKTNHELNTYNWMLFENPSTEHIEIYMRLKPDSMYRTLNQNLIQGCIKKSNGCNFNVSAIWKYICFFVVN